MRFLVAFAVTLAVFGLSTAADPAKDKDAPRLRLLVPAYFYPAGDGAKDWDRLFAASDDVPIVAIVNPASGPGKKADANYVKLFAKAKRSEKVTLIGYVSTSYGKRPPAEVRADVDRWVQLYPGIRGIFFDEQASGADRVEYYAALYKYVRARPGLKLVVANPGTTCVEKYLSEPAADAACLFEGPKPIESVAFPKWAAKIRTGPGRRPVVQDRDGRGDGEGNPRRRREEGRHRLRHRRRGGQPVGPPAALLGRGGRVGPQGESSREAMK